MNFLRKTWHFIVVAVAMAITWLLVGRSRQPLAEETAARIARAAAKRLKNKHDRDEAVRQVEEQYRETISQLEEHELAQASRLAIDPVARADFYARAAQRRQRKAKSNLP